MAAEETETLRERIRERGFSPRARDRDGLVELLGDADADVEKHAERALVRLGESAAVHALARFGDAKAPLRGRLLRVAARAGRASPAVRAALITALTDADAKSRKTAAIALGKLRGDDVERALLDAFAREPEGKQRDALAAALGKAGSTRALDALRAAAHRESAPEGPSTDGREPAMAVADPKRRRAMLMLERTQARAVASVVKGDRAPAAPLAVRVRCRRGLEHLVVDELGRGARVSGHGEVSYTLAKPLSDMFRARTMLTFALALPEVRLGKDESVADGVVRALTSDAAADLLRAFTEGPLRFRLAFAAGGHRRALVWECAERIAATRPELVNDPTESPWEAFVTERAGRLAVELRPRALDDPRFAYRLADVPAASHPTLAAALARVAGAREDDVVWDPFCGSAVELVERARLGPFRELIGSDLDEAALEAARTNLTAAGVPARLELADARTFDPRGVTLVLTNPPMGRRVVHHAELGQLLQAFLGRAARVLVRGGRMVWISPAPERTNRWAKEVDLAPDLEQDVDMGGFTARIQRLVSCHGRAR